MNVSSQSTPDNTSLAYNETGTPAELEPVEYEWFKIAIPVISLIGILGNVLNLVVLSSSRMVAGMDRLGRTANYGLVALAVSDLLFCLTVFPHSFIPKNVSPLFNYYQLYGVAAINLFIMISTWLIVAMAVKRYIVVVYPLHARDQLTQRRNVMVIVSVFILSTLLTLPYFLHLRVIPIYNPDGIPEYKFRPVWSKSITKMLQFYMRWIWPIIADFIPIVLLVFCNVRLIRELQGATVVRRSSCPGQRVKETNNRVTLTLVIIVLMLLILVSPSEILKYINPYKHWGEIGHIVASAANTLQTVNFALNFLLYFAVNAKFRHTLRTLLPPCFDTCWPMKSELSRVFSRTMSRTSRSAVLTDEVDL